MSDDDPLAREWLRRLDSQVAALREAMKRLLDRCPQCRGGGVTFSQGKPCATCASERAIWQDIATAAEARDCRLREQEQEECIKAASEAITRWHEERHTFVPVEEVEAAIRNRRTT